MKRIKDNERRVNAEFIREILDYFPDTGEFVWRSRSDVPPEWNTLHAGNRAGRHRHDNYREIVINSTFYQAHRVAWLWVTGKWPKDEIDHINGKPSDNRFDNLREATRSQNMQNRRSNNRSGTKGVYWDTRRNKWQAKIKIDGVSKHLGRFKTLSEAAEAYRRAVNNAHGEFSNFGVMR